MSGSVVLMCATAYKTISVRWLQLTCSGKMSRSALSCGTCIDSLANTAVRPPRTCCSVACKLLLHQRKCSLSTKGKCRFGEASLSNPLSYQPTISCLVLIVEDPGHTIPSVLSSGLHKLSLRDSLVEMHREIRSGLSLSSCFAVCLRLLSFPVLQL